MLPTTSQPPQTPAPTSSPLLRKLGRFYLFYLGLLPVLATFALSATGTRFPLLVFLGGVGAVGVYLAWLLGGIAEARLASFFVVRKDDVLRQDDGAFSTSLGWSCCGFSHCSQGWHSMIVA
jgi:hypothetical protein